MRSGVCLLVVVLAAAAAASSARADGRTSATTTSATTTGGTTTTGTTTAPSFEPLAATPLHARCVGAGGVLIVEPGATPLALDTPAVDLAAAAYPDDASVASFSAASGNGSTCGSGSLSLASLSLFGGAVTATSVTVTGGTSSVEGLAVGGTPVTTSAGETLPVGDWGQLSFDGVARRLSLGGELGRRLSAAVVLRLLRRRGTLPGGTMLLVGFTEAAPVAKATKRARPHVSAKRATHATHVRSKLRHRHRHKKRKHRVPQPLKATPHLGQRHYVFPVDGGASYVDTYGAGRSDIYDGWHHGDDLFAPLGTPVVAVARGKLTLVGWNQLGGWRLWLTDRHGNSFYYAHLAGYARWILQHRNVKAGQVLGFLGRTGDAFTTPPHLHFEVHPHQLLRLGYDGAVDPTTYLQSWRVVRVPARTIPHPARLVAPKGTPRQEANVVWHELLAARHLVRRHHVGRRSPRMPAALRRPFPQSLAALAQVTRLSPPLAAERVAERIAQPRHAGAWPTVLVAAVLSAGLLGLLALRRLRAPRRG